jgi:hypothetical protein
MEAERAVTQIYQHEVAMAPLQYAEFELKHEGNQCSHTVKLSGTEITLRYEKGTAQSQIKFPVTELSTFVDLLKRALELTKN